LGPWFPIPEFNYNNQKQATNRKGSEVEWRQEGIICQFSSATIFNGMYLKQYMEGRIRKIDSFISALSIELRSGETLRNVPFDAVSKPIPQNNDHLKIVSGDQYVGSYGTLWGMDESDCIIKLDESKKICLVNFQHLGIVKRA